MKLANQFEIMLNLGPNVCLNTIWPAPSRSRIGQLPQVGCGCCTLRHDFIRVFVAQLVEAEMASVRNGNGLLQQVF